MYPVRPGDDPRIPLIRSVTYVRALFPWELRNVRGANDDQVGQARGLGADPPLPAEDCGRLSPLPEV